jgi:D-alanyl-D-alanine carboxypeptidase
VTIRALLSHRSGLPNYTDIDEAISDALADRSRQFTPDEIVGYVNSVPPSAADQRFAYSNTNYILLGQLVEQLDGTDLNTALHNRITGPLRLAATRFATGDDPTPDGYGLGLGAAGFGPHQSGYGHGGAIFGYTTIMAINPATGDAVIIATNNDELVADELAAQVVEHW